MQIIDKSNSTKINGYGTIISTEGIILTTNRAMKGNNIFVRTSDLRLHKVKKVLFSQAEDNLAIIKIQKSGSLNNVEYLNNSNVKLGDKVINVSSYYKGDYKATNSIIGKIIGSESNNTRIMVLINNENIQPSLEGSPVFNKKGQLIGFISLVSGRNFNKVAYSPILEDFKSTLSKYIVHEDSTNKQPQIRKVFYKQNISVIEKKKKEKELKKPNTKKKSFFSFLTKNKKEKISKTPKSSENKKNKIISKPEIVVSSAYGLPNKTYKEKIYPSNDFSIPLAGLWFDTTTGQSIYMTQNGSIVEISRTQDRIYNDSLDRIVGQFKKEGNKYVGEIVSYLNCDKNNCNIKEPAELLYWNKDKIELKVKSGDSYSCNYCLNPDQTEWKNRMWLKKANR